MYRTELPGLVLTPAYSPEDSSLSAWLTEVLLAFRGDLATVELCQTEKRIVQHLPKNPPRYLEAVTRA